MIDIDVTVGSIELARIVRELNDKIITDCVTMKRDVYGKFRKCQSNGSMLKFKRGVWFISRDNGLRWYMDGDYGIVTDYDSDDGSYKYDNDGYLLNKYTN